MSQIEKWSFRFSIRAGNNDLVQEIAEVEGRKDDETDLKQGALVYSG